MKLLCEKCYTALVTREHAGLGVYVEPCPCAATREAEVATAACDYSVHACALHYSMEVENALALCNLDGKDDLHSLAEMNEILVTIVRGENDIVIENIYDELDI